jgi:2-hydroxycyclohexanecarboxyl-CoA dehydrogenase
MARCEMSGHPLRYITERFVGTIPLPARPLLAYTTDVQLDRKIALVTGAGSGIGRAIAQRLAAEGARVAAADIVLARAQETVDLIRQHGGSGLAVFVDVTSFEIVNEAVAKIRDDFGEIDVLVNNAGWDRVEPFVENTPNFWHQVIAINLNGPIYCCRAVLDGMIRRGSGKIIQIGSDAGRVGSTGEAVYSACKGGMIAFSKTLARELARYHINVNVVAPGPTDTPLLHEITSGPGGAKIIDAMTKAVPFRRLAKPDEIAAAVAFFAGPDSDFITGQVLSVSGGLSMVG